MLIADPNPYTPNRQSVSASQKALRRLRQGTSAMVLVILGQWLIKPLFEVPAPATIPSTVAIAEGSQLTPQIASELASTATASLSSPDSRTAQQGSTTLNTRTPAGTVHPIPVLIQPEWKGAQLVQSKGSDNVGVDLPLNQDEVSREELLATLNNLDARSMELNAAWDAPKIVRVAKLAYHPVRLSIIGGVQSMDFTQINAFQLGFRAEKSLNTSLSILSGLHWNRQFFGQLEYAGEAMFEAANPNLPGYAIKPSNVPSEYIRASAFQVDLIQIPLELQYHSPRQLWKASAGLTVGLPVQVNYSSGTTLQEKQLFDDRARQGLSEGIAKRFFTATLAVQIPVHESLEMEVRGNLGLNDISNDTYMGISDSHKNKGIQIGLIWKY